MILDLAFSSNDTAASQRPNGDVEIIWRYGDFARCGNLMAPRRPVLRRPDCVTQKTSVQRHRDIKVTEISWKPDVTMAVVSR